MNIRLRGHHLLCLLGFRGMGYSPEFTKNMITVYEQLRAEPHTIVTIASGIDDLCKCYPSDKLNHCSTSSVHTRDQQVLNLLGLSAEDQITWEKLLQIISERVSPGDIPRYCATCPWEPYGVCEEGVARIARGEGLSPLPMELPVHQ